MIGLRTQLFITIAAVFIWAQTATAQTTVFINEVDADTPSRDKREFIELFDGGGGNTALDGLVIVLFDGAKEVSYKAFDLANYSTNADGYFVLGNTNLTPAPDLDIGAGDILQNGPDAVALYRGNASDFPRGTAVTTDNLIDALVYDTEDSDDADLLTLLNNGQPQVNENGQGDQANHSNQRLPNGSGGALNTSSYDQAIPTPGSQNINLESSDKPLAIYDIQGADHISLYLNRRVRTSGIITAVVSKGFYLQDFRGDGDDSTSDGIFVYTGSKPDVDVGNLVMVTGTVDEYTPHDRPKNLSVTQISGFVRVDTISSKNSLPVPIIIGAKDRQPPTEIIDDDSLTLFNPSSDGIDFYESLEGMRVTIAGAQVVAPSNSGKIFIVPASSATGLNQRGGITISAGDFNPERLLINNRLLPLPKFKPLVKPGDSLGDVTVVIAYDYYGNFEGLLTTTPTVTYGSIARENTTLRGDDNHLLIATYNVKNLDPNDQEFDKEERDRDIDNGQFDSIAVQIVNNLNQPDIIALQEVQDNSGSDDDSTVVADQTLQVLINSIVSAGGPTYSFIDNPPDNNQDGGQPGGNIRVVFLYNEKRVSFVDSLRLEDNDGNDAFEKTRKSLQATFKFNGEQIVLINNHFSSRRRSSSLFGKRQPPIKGDFRERKEQATFINDLVDGLLRDDPEAKIVVLGDFNEYQFEEPLSILEGTSDGGSQLLFNLDAELSETDRYSYIFQGNSQKLDHILVSRALWDLQPQFDVVHLNCEFPNAPSDHDPLVARLRLNP